MCGQREEAEREGSENEWVVAQNVTERGVADRAKHAVEREKKYKETVRKDS